MFAIDELWRRWAPDHFGVFMLDDMMDELMESKSDEPKLRQFERIWTVLKERIILPNGIRSFDEIYKRFDLYYDVESIFFEYEGYFVSECLAEKENRDE